MTFTEVEARARFAGARVARLATVGPGNQPHLVPVTFAVRQNVVVIAVDHKPKSTTDLKRLRNIRSCDRVSLLVDHYEDEWSRLWWVRADGQAKIIESAREEPVEWLVQKYPQVRGQPTGGAGHLGGCRQVALVELPLGCGQSMKGRRSACPLACRRSG